MRPGVACKSAGTGRRERAPMRIWIHRLGSLKIAGVLLTLIMIAMAAGTMIESARGTGMALQYV